MITRAHTVLALLLAAGALSAASCTGGTVNAETSRPGAIANARTFGPRTGPSGVVPGPAGATAPGWIAAAVSRELTGRGLAEKASPDVEGAARVILGGQPMTYARFGPRSAFPKFEKMKWSEGTLIVEFYSARTTDLVWRGVAEGLIKPGVTKEDIDRALAEMFATWLPVHE